MIIITNRRRRPWRQLNTWQSRNTGLTNLSNSLSPCSTVLVEKLIITQVVKKFSAFYGNRKFITTFTKAHRRPLSWTRCMQSTTSYPISLRSILIISSHLHLGLPSGILLSDFPNKLWCEFLICLMRATCSVNLILLDLITLIVYYINELKKWKWLIHCTQAR
jgi:hypothetical protein